MRVDQMCSYFCQNTVLSNDLKQFSFQQINPIISYLFLSFIDHQVENIIGIYIHVKIYLILLDVNKNEMKTTLSLFLPFTSCTSNIKKGCGRGRLAGEALVASSSIIPYEANKRKLQACFVTRPPWGNSLLTALERIKGIFEVTSV